MCYSLLSPQEKAVIKPVAYCVKETKNDLLRFFSGKWRNLFHLALEMILGKSQVWGRVGRSEIVCLGGGGKSGWVSLKHK